MISIKLLTILHYLSLTSAVTVLALLAWHYAADFVQAELGDSRSDTRDRS